MRKYYTRPCNFYYGVNAKRLIKSKKALPVAGNTNIAFDQLEVFKRVKNRKTTSVFYSLSEIKDIKENKRSVILKDLKTIISKRKKIANIDFKFPKIMGVLNMTPDSFSDGGLFLNKIKAYKQANLMIKNGASILDIGGESTKPGSKTIDKKTEWKRIQETIKIIKKKFPKIVVSLDTRKSSIMSKGIKIGVNIINDVSGLKFDKESFKIIISKKIPFILNHMQGSPKSMQKKPYYTDALLDIYDFFEKNINSCLKKNYNKELIIIDPGIGFGKNLNHNLRIMSKISTFHSLGCPILIGVSRKRFIKHIVTKFDTPDRTGGTLASVLYGLLQGVQLFRIHNVKEINQGILVFNKILNTN
jgi:dihydropteroate synthase